MQYVLQLLRFITTAVSLVFASFRTCSGHSTLQFLGQPQFTAYVSRATPPGSIIYTLVAVNTTHSRPEGISYSLIEDSYDPTLFELNTYNGQLIILQYLPLQNWVLEIQAELQGEMQSVTSDLNVIVLPEYNIMPVFEKKQFSFSLSEYTPVDSLFGIVRAFSLDPDNSDHSYSIISGNTGNDLHINNTTGILRVSRELDYEITHVYNLIVEYSDGGAQVSVSVQLVVLDENDNYPHFSEVVYEITLSESAPINTLVTTLSATDRDSNENGMISYTIIDEDVRGFEIDGSDVHTTTPLDYEQDTVHSFTVAAYDHGVPRLTSTVIVVVTVFNEDDECPVFDSTYYSITIPPESIELGMVVATVHAIDPDNISSVTYSLESDPSNDLNLDPVTGSITLHTTSPSNQYTLRVFASDDSCVDQSFIDVVINIHGSENNSPQFDGPCEAQVLESISSGEIITTIVASDDDAGVYGELIYTFSESSTEFTLDHLTGVVTLSEGIDLDYEQTSSYLIGVTATDGGNKQAYCILSITVLDINDNQPLFLASDYEVRIPQNHVPGTFVVQPLAEDADSGLNRVIEYTISGNVFIIDPTSGVITTESQLTDSEQSYSFIVEATNVNTSPILSSTASVTVNIDTDILIPTFNQSKYSAEICENVPFSTEVLQVFSNIPINQVFLSLISGTQYYSNGDRTFNIDIDGNIMVSSQSNVDFEQLPDSKFIFSVKMESFGGDSLSISTVEITVLDSDDNEPSFRSDSIFSSVSENSPVGTLVTSVPATDPDTGTNSDITYSLVTEEESFAISESGDLTTLVVFDAETTQETLSVRILASNLNPIDNEDICTLDTMRGTANVLIRVNILNINDNLPSFVNPPDILTLSEDTVLGTIITFHVIDLDVNSDPTEIRYTISDGNTGNNFMINNTGHLVLVQSLDYEQQSEYELTVQVSDGILSSTTVITIMVTDVDDEPPIFLNTTYYANITENIPQGTIILQISATDIDTTNISYWLTGLAEGRLTVSITGVITVIGNIDREEFKDGLLSFVAVAQGGIIATTTVNITITDLNDCVPRFPHIDIMIIPENVTPDEGGIDVGTVTAYDSDMGRNGEISYSLLIGEEYGFTINPTTGNIIAHGTYDRETVPLYTLLVEARDMGDIIQLFTTTSLQIKIGDENDNAPYFPFPYIYKRIFENTPVATEVIQLPVVDLDEGTNAALTFTLISSEPDIGQIFTFHNTTGVITLAQELDYEIPNHRFFTITFSVADSVYEADYEATLEIEILDQNDHNPVFNDIEHDLSILETASIGTIILELTAIDQDSGMNAQIQFSIVSGDPDNDFVLTSTGNEAALTIAKQLDYETKTNYDVIVEACDQGIPSQCNTLQISITVENINDVAPFFSQSFYEGSVVEHVEPVDSILQVIATDPDYGDSFEYQIQSGNDDGKFSINSTTGVLSSTVSLDREKQDMYILVITAADEGGTLLSGTGTAIITVTDIDDNPPANESEWHVHMLLLDGQLQTRQSIPIYFDDPDPTSTFSKCLAIETLNTGSFFTVDVDTCTLFLNPGSPSAETEYSIGVQESTHNIYSSVDIDVEHISLLDIPSDYLVTITLAMSTVSYIIDNVYTSFPGTLASVLGIQIEMLTIVSIQDGYHDPINIVDVSFLAMRGDGSYLNPGLILQTLYTQSKVLQTFGYKLQALPTDPCSSEPCISQASCRSLKTIMNSCITAHSPSFVLVSPIVELGYECECVPGTSGENCTINFDDCYSNPCQFDAECIDEVNGFQCVCPSGTSGVDCSVSPDGCSSNPCQNGALCKNIAGSHSCLCLPGYYGTECQYQYFQTASTCDSSPCQNGATCSPGRDSYTCLCPDTHSGQFCELEATPQGCTSNPCYNGSTCIESMSGPICSCSVGFTGPNCRWPIDNCELDPCQNGGTCATGLYGSYQCYCQPPFTGQNCEDFILGCDSNPCLNDGRCSDTIGGSDYTCECKRGFTGDNCEYSVQHVNLCSDNPCLFGNCTYGLTSYTCSCPTDYSGVHCEYQTPPTTPCDSNPCQHGSKCDDNDTGYICTCSPGFTGANCEANIDDCISNPCIQGVCKDGVNGYECECISTQITGYHCDVTCPDGLSGDFCEIVTTQCSADETPCQNGGSCLENLGGYSCMCPPTHAGPMCEQESTCDVVQCYNGGTCSAIDDGGYECMCNEGFDGVNCQLLTISFSQSSFPNTYRAYPSLHLSAKGSIEFEFNTIDSDGLLLYNTQLQSGVNGDYIAIEVKNGQLVVSLSHGEDKVDLVPTLRVNDGQWHHVTVDIIEKVKLLIYAIDYLMKRRHVNVNFVHVNCQSVYLKG